MDKTIEEKEAEIEGVVTQLTEAYSKAEAYARARAKAEAYAHAVEATLMRLQIEKREILKEKADE